LNDFIQEWEQEKVELEEKKKRKRDHEVHTPYASDVSEGKTNPIYKAHSYHTKVPHLAIMRYILHYTQPGDIVFDGFAGTGMTGVAAQFCEKANVELKHQIANEFEDNGSISPKWGERKAICNDLSPIASFIAYNFNTPVDTNTFKREGKRILEELEKEIGWMYETDHLDPASGISTGKIGRIDYTVWSEVLSCPSCMGDVVFTDAAMDAKSKNVSSALICPHCSAEAKKEHMDLQFETFVDPATNMPNKRPKRVPTLIVYRIGKEVFSKVPDQSDLSRLKKIEQLPLPHDLPIEMLPDMQMTRVGRMRTTNTTAIHNMYLPRAAQAMGELWKKANSYSETRLRNKLYFMVEQAIWGLSILARYTPTHFSQVNQYLSGVFYVASQLAECSPWYILNGKLDRLSKINWAFRKKNSTSVSTGTAANVQLNDESIDYIFTDPPFGENIYYSDLNFLIESWHKVWTNPNPEAIVDRVRNKSINDYHQLMYNCFCEYFRILKPGRWMTVEFSNTGAAIWNGIQTALQRAGFVIANVAALNKKQGSFMAVTTPTAVKQDLVISCYKPTHEFDERFKTHSGEINVWDFISEHLSHLPISIIKEKRTSAVVERSPKILYDRLISFYLMKNLPVPIDASDFQIKIRQQYREADGMIFTQEQYADYENQKRKIGISDQISFVFDAIYSESDAVAWLKEKLEKTPAKRQDLYTDFRKANAATRKGEKELELSVLLEENFIQEADGKWRVPDPNEVKDREILRNKALLKEFTTYLGNLALPKPKKLKDVRLEALRVGYKDLWEKKDFSTILKLSDYIPQNLLMEDEMLLTYYDIARDRV
jgi:DNA modification methylase